MQFFSGNSDSWCRFVFMATFLSKTQRESLSIKHEKETESTEEGDAERNIVGEKNGEEGTEWTVTSSQYSLTQSCIPPGVT